MQFTTQSRAETPGYLPQDFSGLVCNYTDIFNLSVDASSTTSDQAWDGSLMARLEYAALAGALASGSTDLPTLSLEPTVIPYAHLGPVNSSYVSFEHCHMTTQLPGVSCASTQGDDLLWGNCGRGLLSEAPVDIDSWGSLISSSLTEAGPAVDTVPDPAELWQTSYDSTHAFPPYEALHDAYGAYSSLSSHSPSTSSLASDCASVFSPARSPSSSGTAPTASSSTSPSPEPMAAPSPQHSKPRRSRKATHHVGRVHSSASQPSKPSHSVPFFASGRVHTTASRNKQVPASENKEAVRHGDTWFCSNCSYQTCRKGDMRRHAKTHSATTQFVCCGVPVEDVPPGYVGDVHYHEGREMVGGCMNAFKRKDSLLRHLKASEGACIEPIHLGSS